MSNHIAKSVNCRPEMTSSATRTTVGLVLGIFETVLRISGNHITPATIVLVALLLISGTQFTLFAMWFDMESNKDLR